MDIYWRLSCSFFIRQSAQAILVQIKTAAYEGNFQNRLVYPSSAESFISSVGLDLAVGSFELDRPVHAEQAP